MPEPTESEYWEDIARGIGWADDQVKQAGQIGPVKQGRPAMSAAGLWVALVPIPWLSS